ncbi:cytochrome P450 [Minicystis rosea]|nr:cytochrome P450 [Minicystis rosea]
MLEGFAAKWRDIGLLPAPSPKQKALVFVNAPELIAEVLIGKSACFEKSEFQRSVIGAPDRLGSGLLTSSNEDHRSQQRLIGEAFKPTRLQDYTQILAECARDLQASWADGAEIDVPAEAMRLATRTLGLSLFSTDMSPDGLDDRVDRATATVADSITSRYVGSARQQMRAESLENASAWLRTYLAGLIRSRVDAPRRGRDDLLDVLLSARASTAGVDPWDDEQLIYDIGTILLAGTENPKNSTAWALHLLAAHPEVRARLVAEVDGVLEGRLPTHADLGRLTYTQQVYKEVLRLWPPGYAFSRTAVQPVTVGGIDIPVGAEVLVSPYVLHRRADLYPNPTVFDPDRFAPSTERRLHRMAYLPFGAGPRACIGGGFAMIQGPITLAVLAQSVLLDAVPGQHVEPEPMVTMRPSAFTMRVRRRPEAPEVR